MYRTRVPKRRIRFTSRKSHPSFCSHRVSLHIRFSYQPTYVHSTVNFDPHTSIAKHKLILLNVRWHSNAPQNGLTKCILKSIEGCLVTLQLVLWPWNLKSTASLHHKFHMIPFRTRRRLPVILPVCYHQPFCISRTTVILLAVCFFFVSFVYYSDRYASLLAYGSILYPAMQATHETVLWRHKLPSPSPDEWTQKTS
jgi:hypothetical protein